MSRFLLFWLCPHPEGHCGPESRQVSPGQREVARTSPGVGDKLPRESLLEALSRLPFSMVQAARTPLRSKCGRGLMGGTPLLSFTSEVWTITGWIEAPLEKMFFLYQRREPGTHRSVHLLKPLQLTPSHGGPALEKIQLHSVKYIRCARAPSVISK